MSESGFPDLVRFVEAQDSGGTYATALAELRRGRKTSHWMWFVLPQVAGYVRKIHVTPGQRVESGQPLLDVDARQESAALQSAQAQARSAKSSLELARQTLQRTQQLYREGLVSAQELERTQAAADAAEAQSGSVGAQVVQRQVQLQFFSVRAPFAGTMGDVTVRVGDFVTATTPVTSVAQADALDAYDQDFDLEMHAAQKQFLAGDPLCKAV